jgi:DNA-binding response OmpR family regulator
MPHRLTTSVISVLFVDPDIDSARRLAAPLRERCAVAVVGSAHEAMEAMRIRMPTMVVTELHLPDTDGAQWISNLHHSPATHQVLLMVVTWRSTIRDKITAFQAGADDFLVKPVEPEVFITHFGLLSRFRQVIGMR